jgi:dolichol-phosphate mannosyltransferase
LTILLACLYGWFVFTALTNLLLMPRPRGKAPLCFDVLIPARNETGNIQTVVAPLTAQGVRVVVFDDGSEDETAALARKSGAEVISSAEPLPSGWTGKTRACHELSGYAEAEWAMFLDADTMPQAAFAETLSAYLSQLPANIRVVSGFPKMLPGQGLEPAYLGWVPWILLATNPFGLVALTGRGHNRFLNGQFSAWRKDFLSEFEPFEKVRGEILEDVKLGRLLAKCHEPAPIVNLTSLLSVRMYNTLSEAVEGMSKNSAFVAGPGFGSVVLAAFLAFLGFGWIFAGPWWPWLLAAFLASKVVVDRAIRYPLWTVPFLPLTCLAAALTVLRSEWFVRTKRLSWKGRNYSG